MKNVLPLPCVNWRCRGFKRGHREVLSVLGSRWNANVSTIGDITMKNFLLCMTAAVSFVALTSGAQARSTYDGPWNLLFVTQSGACDPTYNFSVNITNGIVTHPNLVKFRG